MSKIKPRHIHVEVTPREFDRVQAIKGDTQKWKPWLLSLPDQFRSLHERAEMFRLRAENAEKENEDLRERIRLLQTEESPQ